MRVLGSRGRGDGLRDGVAQLLGGAWRACMRKQLNGLLQN
jgi:hypothetical protein